jgi:hypothetical protein
MTAGAAIGGVWSGKACFLGAKALSMPISESLLSLKAKWDQPSSMMLVLSWGCFPKLLGPWDELASTQSRGGDGGSMMMGIDLLVPSRK